jgi:hypothetical protein
MLLSDLTSLLRPPHVFLILGTASILAAAIFTRMGKVWVRFNGWVYRTKEPRWFGMKSLSIIWAVFGSSDASCIRVRGFNWAEVQSR